MSQSHENPSYIAKALLCSWQGLLKTVSIYCFIQQGNACGWSRRKTLLRKR